MMRAVAHPSVTEPTVKELLKARKVIRRTVRSNWGTNTEASRIEVVYDVRRIASPHENIGLRLTAWLPLATGGTPPYPSVSLLWHGERIRCVDWKWREDVIKDNLVTGIVRRWHEHQWTDTDHGRFVVSANHFVKNPDFWGLMRVCLKRWKIADSTRQMRLGE